MMREQGEILLITNNVRIQELYGEKWTISIKVSYFDVLLAARDYIHRGYVLLTHPLSGSLKPNQTPFKTVVLEKQREDQTDLNSLTLIENTLDAYEKFGQCHKLLSWGDKATEDFRTVDVSFMKSVFLKL